MFTELNDLKIKNEELNKVKHENSNLIAINKVLLKEQTYIKTELDAERSTVKTWTKSSSKVYEILDSQIQAGHKSWIGL